ncbi:MAG: hypothetical protein ACP5D2_02480 [Candidatus Nanoarchaeia archaeon]
MPEDTNKTNKEWWYIIIVGLSISVLLLGMYFVFNNDDNESPFCLISEPEYMLNCTMNNQTIQATASAENVQKAIDEHDCQIIDETHRLNIIYCYENVTEDVENYRLLAKSE